ncbi:AgrD family cyclic lactone autoinducer peptide [Agathobacter rectalis]|nr:cyclic lactone autoinducer peptide [Agathobacter rectalis]
MNSLKRLTLELVKKVVIFEIKRDNETHPFCACILYQPKRPEKGRFQVTNNRNIQLIISKKKEKKYEQNHKSEF